MESKAKLVEYLNHLQTVILDVIKGNVRVEKFSELYKEAEDLKKEILEYEKIEFPEHKLYPDDGANAVYKTCDNCGSECERKGNFAKMGAICVRWSKVQ